MARILLISGTLLGGLAVAAGAFGAHLLQEHLSSAKMESYETAARYQMYHALALVALGLWALLRPQARLAVPGLAMLAGTLLFSGSIYLWLAGGPSWLVLLTPVGGSLLIFAWAAALYAAWQTTAD